jgi:hypothetical protein
LRLFLIEEKNWTVLSVGTRRDENLIFDYISNSNDKACVGLFGYFTRFAELGHNGFNSDQLHEVDKSESIYQFSKGKHRVLFFNIDGKAVMLSCPHLKKSGKVDSNEVKKAIKIKREYLDALSCNDIDVIRE